MPRKVSAKVNWHGYREVEGTVQDSFIIVRPDGRARYPAVDKWTRAEMIHAVEHWRPWVGLMTLIYMPSPGWVPEDEEYWWAITTPDKGHRPAFFALANMPKVCDDFVIPIRESDSPVALGLEPAPICP